MSSHDCTIFGSITLREDVTEAQILEAFKHLDGDLVSTIEKEQNAGGITIEDGEVSFNVDLSISDNGYRRDGINAFSEALNGLVEGHGHFEVIDLDTGDTEAMRVPYFVGATEDDMSKARVEYGLAEAADWLTPIIGKEAFAQIEKTALSAIDGKREPERRIAIIMDGGLIHEIIGNCQDTEIVVIDHDLEGVDEDQIVTLAEDGEDGDEFDAYLSFRSVGAPDWRLEKAFEER